MPFVLKGVRNTINLTSTTDTHTPSLSLSESKRNGNIASEKPWFMLTDWSLQQIVGILLSSLFERTYLLKLIIVVAGEAVLITSLIL